MSQQINLFNPVFLHQRKLFSLVTMLQMLSLIVLGSALFYIYAVYQLNSLTEQLHETNKRLDAEQARLSRYTSKSSPQGSVEDELKSIDAKLAILNDRIKAVNKIGSPTGYSKYMRAFARQTVSGLWLTGFDIAGDAEKMSITGNVLSPELLADYILRLNHEPDMREKKFASLFMQREAKEGRSVKFKLSNLSNEIEKTEADKAKDDEAAKK